jgi:glycosyltransferase involved in cell wall biosynthesis
MTNIAIILLTNNHSGTERAVCNLANILAESGEYLPTIIYVPSERETPNYHLHERVKVKLLGLNTPQNLVKRLAFYRVAIRRIQSICRDERTDILLGTAHGINVILPFIKHNNMKTIGCEHLNYMAAPLYSRILRRMFYPFLNAVVVLTQSDARHYTFHKNVAVIPNSLPFIPENTSTLENRILLAVGRLADQKGFDMLINAIALMREPMLSIGGVVHGN